MDKEYSIGSVVGRFQVHELHDAHRYVIDQVVNNHKKSIIFLGVPKVVGTKKNPLDFDTRKKMIQSSYPDTLILSLPDIGDDFKWTAELDKRIREVYPIGEVVLYGGRDSFIPYYQKGKGQFDCKELDQYTFVSGTEVRKIVDECFATLGEVSNEEHHLRNFGKAGRSRWMGIKPTVRGTAMNPVDHPYGGGEGRQGRGTRRAKSVYGKPTGKGQKSRTPKKYSNKFIVSRRVVGKKR
jgi:hypothetical protein